MSPFAKHMISFLLLLAFTVQHAGRLFLVADYYLNRSAYLEACVNKYKPSMHCDGQCLLMKKIQKAEDKANTNPEKKLEWKYEVFSRKSFYADITPVFKPYQSNLHTYFPAATPAGYHPVIFHPPGV